MDLLSTKDKERLKDIILHAGKEVMEIYESASFSIEQKMDESPITLADKKSNEVINAGLQSLENSYPILSEENKEIPQEDRMKMRTLWIVDPLDGTKEFIHKNGEFAICIALVHDSRPVAGLVYAPVKDELYYAWKGEGAFLETKKQKSALVTKPFDPNASHLRIAVSRSHRNPLHDEFIEKYKYPELVTKGSILKMTEIARGNIEIYPRFDEKTKEWDIAAGQVILEEAGGSVIDRNTNEPVKYNKSSLQSPPFLAQAPSL